MTEGVWKRAYVIVNDGGCFVHAAIARTGRRAGFERVVVLCHGGVSSVGVRCRIAWGHDSQRLRRL